MIRKMKPTQHYSCRLLFISIVKFVFFSFFCWSISVFWGKNWSGHVYIMTNLSGHLKTTMINNSRLAPGPPVADWFLSTGSGSVVFWARPPSPVATCRCWLQGEPSFKVYFSCWISHVNTGHQLQCRWWPHQSDWLQTFSLVTESLDSRKCCSSCCVYTFLTVAILK